MQFVFTYIYISMKTALKCVVGSLAAGVSMAALAVTSATFTFDAVSDPGDLADGPDYDIVGVGPVDDGTGCDAVAMIMVDPTGRVTDMDELCLDLATGLGGSDGDYGSIDDGYMPVSSPVTYGLFEVTPAAEAAMAGMSESDRAAYLRANARLLYQASYAVPGLPSATPYSFLAAVAVPVGNTLGLLMLSGAIALVVHRRRRFAAAHSARLPPAA